MFGSECSLKMHVSMMFEMWGIPPPKNLGSQNLTCSTYCAGNLGFTFAKLFLTKCLLCPDLALPVIL